MGNDIHISKLTLLIAKKLLDNAEKTALKMNVPVTISIVDESGNVIALHKMDNSILISIKASISKAYTSLALKTSTQKLQELVKPDGDFYTLQNIRNSNLCFMSGGIPIEINGKVIGAIGVSGGTKEEDIRIAESAFR